MSSDELFYCERLKCKLLQRSCADRHAKAQALRPDKSKGKTIWRPSVWAPFEPTCRECEIGDKHLAIYPIKVKMPKRGQEKSPLPNSSWPPNKNRKT